MCHWRRGREFYAVCLLRAPCPLPPSRAALHAQKSGLVWAECTHTIPTGSDLILLGKSHYFPSRWAPWSTHIIGFDNLYWVWCQWSICRDRFLLTDQIPSCKGSNGQGDCQPVMISQSETRDDFSVWNLSTHNPTMVVPCQHNVIHTHTYHTKKNTNCGRGKL